MQELSKFSYSWEQGRLQTNIKNVTTELLLDTLLSLDCG